METQIHNKRMKKEQNTNGHTNKQQPNNKQMKHQKQQMETQTDNKRMKHNTTNGNKNK